MHHRYQLCFVPDYSNCEPDKRFTYLIFKASGAFSLHWAQVVTARSNILFLCSD